MDPDNKIVQLCAKGMEKEGQSQPAEAAELFKQAWGMAESDEEKYIAAHYVARHQSNVTDKLKWDQTALEFALKVNDEKMKGAYPSLYLNIAKCHEDLNDLENAKKHYELALSFTQHLGDDGLWQFGKKRN